MSKFTLSITTINSMDLIVFKILKSQNSLFFKMVLNLTYRSINKFMYKPDNYLKINRLDIFGLE